MCCTVWGAAAKSQADCLNSWLRKSCLITLPPVSPSQGNFPPTKVTCFSHNFPVAFNLPPAIVPLLMQSTVLNSWGSGEDCLGWDPGFVQEA